MLPCTQPATRTGAIRVQAHFPHHPRRRVRRDRGFRRRRARHRHHRRRLTFVYPILSKWSAAYAKKTGNKINYQSIGSGGGIAQIKAGTVIFGASDKPLEPQRRSQKPAWGSSRS